MKKANLFTCTSLLLALVMALPRTAQACTNILVTKGASATGSTIISYSADSHTLYGELYYRQAATYSNGEMMQIHEWDTGKPLGEIAQAHQTYSVVGNMNEHQVVIGESTWGGLPQLEDSTGVVDYGSLIYIALQRSKTAREAVQVMTDLVAEYGYASSGESFSIADGNEVWLLEMIGKGTKLAKGKNVNKGAVWVARRVPDGMISAHANQARITTFPLNDKENCLYAKDVISFARAQGLYTGADKDFNFAKTYNPFDFSGMRGCEGRVWSVFRQVTDGMEAYEDHITGKNPENRLPLWVAPKEKITLHQVAEFMRDHYEGTVLDMTQDVGAGAFALPYRWRPLSWTVGDEEFCNERAIATQQTGWWYVAESRSWLPDPIGGVLWFGVDDADSSPLTPFYCGITQIPEPFAVGNGDMMTYSETSMFWLANRVANFAYQRYNIIHPEVEVTIALLEEFYLSNQASMDSAALLLYQSEANEAGLVSSREGGNSSETVTLLNDYATLVAQTTFKFWQQLDRRLLVRYIDGNRKKVDENNRFIDNGHGVGIPASPDFPGYSDAWKEAVKNDAGHRLRVIQPEGVPTSH